MSSARVDSLARQRLFEGLRIHFVPKQIGPVQLGILKKNVTKNGGTVTEAFDMKNIDIIISNAGFMKAYEFLQEKAGPKLSLEVLAKTRMHTSDWVTESIQRNVLLDPTDHRVHYHPPFAAFQQPSLQPLLQPAPPPTPLLSLANSSSSLSSTTFTREGDSSSTSDSPVPVLSRTGTIIQTSTAPPRKHRTRPGRSSTASLCSGSSLSSSSTGSLSKFASASRFYVPVFPSSSDAVAADPTSKSIYSTKIVPTPKRRKLAEDQSDQLTTTPRHNAGSSSATTTPTQPEPQLLFRSRSLDSSPMDTQPTSWLAYAIDDTDSQVLDFGDFGEDTQPSNATIDAKRPSSTSDLSTLVTFSQLPTAIAAVLMDDAPSLALPDVPASQPTIPRSLEKLSHRRAAARAHVQGIVDSEEGSTPSTPSPAVPATLADASQSLRRHNIIDYPDLNDADELMVGPADDGLGDMLKARAARKSSGNLVTGDSSDDDIDSQDRKDGEEEFFHEHARQKHNRFFEGTYQDYLPNISELEKTRRLRRREFFVCQKGPEAPSTNLNKHITDVLETLEQTCKNSGERWREYAYRKAVQILKSRPERIESADQARKLRGIGSRIADKIGEILETGTLRKAELQRSDEMTQTFALFGNVFGAGPTTIQKWYAMGYRTLEDLAAKANLNHQQQVGVQYYHEFLERMPREEVSRISARITAVIQQLDKDFIVEVCGSYRRLKTDCGDMDILVTHPRHIKLHGFLATAIPALRDAGLITDELTSSSKSPSQDKFMGVCWGGSGLHRRIDIQCVPLEEWPFALLYFTGSGHFNRSMRLWARRHGFSLSEHSLVRRFANDLKGDPILGIKTEKDIFDALGLEYKAPHERDV